MKDTIENRLILRTRNTGDYWSAPLRYFELDGAKLCDLRDSLCTTPAARIYGGGALGVRLERHDRYRKADDGRPSIAWAVGVSIHGETEVPPAPEWVTLYGSREYGQKGSVYVPCASCMHHLFDKERAPERDAVFYYNRDPRIRRPDISGIPKMDNERPLRDILDFLGSAEVVVTNSYHGAYWATLLGRKVVIAGVYSSKFHHFKYPPAYSDSNWRVAAAGARNYPQALEDARSINRAFFARVQELIR